MVLKFIRQFIAAHAYPPSIRDICQATGIRSGSSVHHYLNKLEEKGFIHRDSTRSRAIEIIEPNSAVPADVVLMSPKDKIAVGQPVRAVENIKDTFPLSSKIAGGGKTFVLQMQDDSMIEAGILDDDYLIARPQSVAENGDIVVALLENETTVKYFQRSDYRIELVPANSKMQSIIAKNVTILGKVIGLCRSI